MGDLPGGALTFLFTDIEGSSRLWEAHGEIMKTSLAAHDELSAQVVDAHGGAVFKQTGDGICAAFPSAAAAICAAVDLQARLAEAEWNRDVSMRVRVGMHTGEAQSRDGDYFGPTLNRTARITATGHGGQTLVSLAAQEMVREQLPHGIVLRDLGRHRLRDLSHPEHLFQVGAGEFPPLRTLDTVTNNLPAQLSTFVGREAELTQLEDVIQGCRLVTLTGVGGTGKTRLALQAAAGMLDRFPDGVFLIELATVTDPSLVAEQVATVLSARGGSHVDSLVAFLRDQRVLLVLDNCEHVIGSTATVAEGLLRRCAEVSVLATSREALGVAGEQVVPVPSLGVPPAAADLGAERLLSFESARLLVDRTTGADPRFAVSDADAEAVASICRRLDGIPLAIELAAARVASLSVAEVVELLDDQFRLLTGGRRTAVERHQTLRAAIDWSYELLGDGARRLLPRLGVFNGGWTLDAARAVCGDDTIESFAVVDALSELVEKSIVAVEHGEGGSRYRMVEPMRHYALEKLAVAGEVKGTRDRHAAWVEERFGARSYRDLLELAQDPDAQARGLAEHANVVEAMRWLLERGDGDTVARLFLGAYVSFFMAGRYREGLQLVDGALAHGGVSCWAQYLAQTYSVVFPIFLGDLESAQARLEEAAAVGEGCPEVTSLHWTTLLRGVIAFSGLGDVRDMRDDLEAAKTHAAEAGDVPAVLYGTWLLAHLALMDGDFERAVALAEQAYEPVKDMPLAWVPYAASTFALAKVLAGHDDEEAVIDEVDRVARRSGDPSAIAAMLVARAAAGPSEPARAALEEVVHLTRRHGLGIRFVLTTAAYDAQHRDDAADVARVLGALSHLEYGLSHLEALTRLAPWESLLVWARDRLGEDTLRDHFEAGVRDGPESAIEGISGSGR